MISMLWASVLCVDLLQRFPMQMYTDQPQTLKPATAEVNNIDHLTAVQSSETMDSGIHVPQLA